MTDPSQALELLLPRPREASLGGTAWRIGGEVVLAASDLGVVVERAILDLASQLQLVRVALRRVDDNSAGGADGPSSSGHRIALVLDPAASDHPQGYRLSIDGGGVRIAAPRPIGVAYGIATLRQWLRLHPAPADSGARSVPALAVRDRPDFEHRGVLQDISRNKVPSLDTLCALIDRFAGWKINQLQLYMEHTFAYRGHEVVWRGADPLTAEEVRRLASHCAARGIELVPNQNSFGHFHRWLIHPPYRSLAVCP